MSDLPPSIWKRPFRGPLKAFIWFLLLVLGSFLVIAAIALITGGSESGGNLILGSFIISISLAGLVFGGLLFLRWIRCWRNVRRLLFNVACLLTLVALAYAEENWRGQHAWHKFRRAGEAKGEKFTIAALVPPPIPDDKNFALAPLLKPSLDYTAGPTGVIWHDTNGVARLDNISSEFLAGRIANPQFLGNIERGSFTDLAACYEFYRGITNYSEHGASATAAEGILAALGKFTPLLDELHEGAATRPLARFPLQYDTEPSWDILIPHLAQVKALTILAEFRSTAELGQNHSTEALEDLKIGLRLSDSIHEEPILISHLVRVVTLGMDLQTVREGLARHIWSDVQLADLQSALASLDLFAEYRLAMRGERALYIEGIDYQRCHPNLDLFAGLGGLRDADRSIFGLPIALRLMPSGWFYQNTLTATRMQALILSAADEQAHRVYPKVSENGARALENLPSGPYTFFAKSFLPGLARAVLKSAQMQTYTDAARVACALERYRQVTGNLPDTLGSLVPSFISAIPNDVIDGKPLRYRRNPDGSYILYSIGWNQKDDGGQNAWINPKTGVKHFGASEDDWANSKSPGNVDAREGDWVWQMPASLPRP